MEQKIFRSADGSFNITLPSEWGQYEVDEYGTYAFFNAHAPYWRTNLRITFMQLNRHIGFNRRNAFEYIQSEAADNEGAEIVELGAWNACRCLKYITTADESFATCYWVAGQNNNLFTCSLIFVKHDLATENDEEVNVVQNILKSIQLNETPGHTVRTTKGIVSLIKMMILQLFR